MEREHLTVARATSESFQVRNARLTIGLQVQPGVLAAFMERDRTPGGSGFLARFLALSPRLDTGHAAILSLLRATGHRRSVQRKDFAGALSVNSEH